MAAGCTCGHKHNDEAVYQVFSGCNQQTTLLFSNYFWFNNHKQLTKIFAQTLYF